MIRGLLVVLMATVLTVFYGTWIFLRCVLGRGGCAEWCWRKARSWSRGVLRVAGVRVELEGAEHLAPGHGQVLVANHQSWFDVFALVGHLPFACVFVGKRELDRYPFFGPAWSRCGHIAIDRSDRQSAVRSLADAAALIRDQQATVVMFPEGTRSLDGRLQRFKKGAFVLAIQAGAEVVPVGINGSRDVMAKGSLRVRPGTVRLRFGEPIPVDGLAHSQRDELLERAKDAVAALVTGGVGEPRIPRPD